MFQNHLLALAAEQAQAARACPEVYMAVALAQEEASLAQEEVARAQEKMALAQGEVALALAQEEVVVGLGRDLDLDCMEGSAWLTS